MLNIAFNLVELTQDELIGLQAMLAAYDRAALGSQIKAKQFEALTPLGEANARMRPSQSFDPASIIKVACPVVQACGDDCVHPDHQHEAVIPEPQVVQETPAEPEATTAPTEPVEAPVAVLGHVPAEPMAPVKRVRRTKAEIEAARAAEAPAPAPAPTPTPTPAPAPGPTSIIELPVPTLDKLRSALQSYTERKGMPAGIELLKDFDCARVSELITMPVEQQCEFLTLAANA